MQEGMFGNKEVAASGNAESKTSVSETGSNDSGSQQPRMFDEAAVQRLVQERLSKQAKKHATERAELEDRLAAFEGVPTVDDEKPVQKVNPVDAEVRRKLSKTERDYKALQDRMDKYRQQTLKATVQSKLVEKDCIDAELAFGDLYSKGMVKMDDDDNVVVDPIYGDLDKLIDEYLGRRDYLRKSKASGGIGSKAPGIAAHAASQKEHIIEQIMAVQQNNKLFGHK